ncbi:hypothetical protein DEO72_LG2g4417 [Vigna unguiculata]|uniref:Uncharacterized protein n=1 Tax=Vigna unguiculata TaxID=3917 RepID=A0A4D6L6B6_VIGUN|nr:hypothetical protein DEO72_LG2g4417 [Vigna unguiculata]
MTQHLRIQAKSTQIAWRNASTARRQVIANPLFEVYRLADHTLPPGATRDNNPLVLLSPSAHTHVARRYTSSENPTGFCTPKLVGLPPTILPQVQNYTHHLRLNSWRFAILTRYNRVEKGKNLGGAKEKARKEENRKKMLSSGDLPLPPFSPKRVQMLPISPKRDPFFSLKYSCSPKRDVGFSTSRPSERLSLG